MAFYRGTEGSVKFDDAGTSAAAIASTTGWTLNVVKETVDTTLIGDRTGYKGTEGGIISGTGTVKVLYTATSGDETEAFLKRVILRVIRVIVYLNFILILLGLKRLVLRV